VNEVIEYLNAEATRIYAEYQTKNYSAHYATLIGKSKDEIASIRSEAAKIWIKAEKISGLIRQLEAERVGA
jgi:hypothetical protein